MSGFQFPPPPPPPPKVSTGPHEPSRGQHTGQERGHGRSRGRNNYSNRGRGGRGGSYSQHQSEQYSANGFNSNTGSNHYNSQGLDNSTSSSQRDPSNFSGYPFNGLPPGSHVNPSFIAGFNHPTSSQIPSRSDNTTNLLPRTATGHKRKLEALRGPQHERKKIGPPTAPSIPSFGAGVLTGSRIQPTLPAQNDTRSTSLKRPSKTLGLTPGHGDPRYSSSESDADDDDIDEEAMHAELGTALTFEHNGTVMSLNSASDLAIWMRERRKNWPTQERMTAKLEEKWRTGQLRKKLMSDAIAVLSSTQSQTPSQAAPRNDVSFRKAVTESDEVKGKMDGNFPSLEGSFERNPTPSVLASTDSAARVDGLEDESEAQPVSINEEADEPNGADDNTESILLSAPLEESSDSSSDDSDDGEPPDEQHSKPQEPVDHHKRRVCRYFSASGFCRDGESCRFMHQNPTSGSGTLAARPPKQLPVKQYANPKKEVHATKGPSGIFQLFTEREQDDEDVLALQAIKFLGESGFFPHAE